jgi:rhodanese-related sulfurtransferase
MIEQQLGCAMRDLFLRPAFGVLLAMVSVPLSFAAEIVSPDSIPGTTKLDAEGVINVVNTVPDLVLVDSRITTDRKQGFIEGSVSLPDIETTCATLAKIIPRKSQPTLFYCNGVKCGRSVKAITTAKECGYSAIYWFRGGFEEWKAKGYPYITE